MSLANSEDPDEMPYNAAFHQGLRCLLRQINDLKKKYNIFPTLQPMTPRNPRFTVSNQKEESIYVLYVRNFLMSAPCRNESFPY